MTTLYTFGDSILDCGHYNPHGLHPGRLLVRNEPSLFPAFTGKDLATLGPARLVHRAEDGATLASLPRQVRGIPVDPEGLAIVTVGGNDLLGGLVVDEGSGIDRFARSLDAWLTALPVKRVFIGTVYDPTFGDDRLNFLGVDAELARRNHAALNAALAEVASGQGAILVDLHRHFLQKGDSSWFTSVIEPSLTGASEVRRCFLSPLLDALRARRPTVQREP